ncbi:hypothetical protein MCA3082 [Methylococcus capsulatus str. Bath]|uniref:Uncharacterized protein n=1 Tax=Methylococcus capsulatus (strain ATCC 33009 / NCIMB 11132 / Bath) TaxID=243233 RepID=Q602I1_METCA|nr:hypothetical protein MCA3082 [Methylococcus capsulatus str. Bath]
MRGQPAGAAVAVRDSGESRPSGGEFDAEVLRPRQRELQALPVRRWHSVPSRFESGH